MATSYKIRLRRFNGLDYDTLNLSSDNIIMGNGNTLQSIIPSSNGIVKINNGIFQTATDGTDYLTRATNYSPIRFVSNSINLASSDIGKTISADTNGGDVVITLPSSLDSDAPTGAEIAFMMHTGNGEARIDMTSISGARYSDGSSYVRVNVAKLTVFQMVVLKKLATGFWVLFGNVEVVT